MAAYMRGVICLLSTERNAFMSRGSGVIVESKRYVRGLRRKPVRVLFPEDETVDVDVKESTRQSQPAGLNVKREREVKVTAAPSRHQEESDFVKARSNVQSAVKDAHVTGTKDQVDGLRIERAFPGDKRLAWVRLQQRLSHAATLASRQRRRFYIPCFALIRWDRWLKQSQASLRELEYKISESNIVLYLYKFDKSS